MVDSLLSPQDSPTRSVSTSGPSGSTGPSGLGPPVVPFRLRKCSIVEEEEDDPDEKQLRVHRFVIMKVDAIVIISDCNPQLFSIDFSRFNLE